MWRKFGRKVIPRHQHNTFQHESPPEKGFEFNFWNHLFGKQLHPILRENGCPFVDFTISFIVDPKDLNRWDIVWHLLEKIVVYTSNKIETHKKKT